MKKGLKNIGLGVISIIAILLAAHEFLKGQEKDKEIDTLKKDNLKLILDSLKQNPNLTNEIKRQLEKLITQFEEIDKIISEELYKALHLIQIGQPGKGIMDLVKIMEHMLDKHYKDNISFKKWLDKKNKTLNNLLTYSKLDKKITDIDLKFFIAIKEIRNKEAHEVGFKVEDYITPTAIVTCLSGIVKIAKFTYPNT